jgi:hypothetical protein
VLLKALTHHVEKGARASLRATVEQCADLQGRPLELHRGGKLVGSKILRKGCALPFHPRVRRRSTFRAIVPASGGMQRGRSRAVAVTAG